MPVDGGPGEERDAVRLRQVGTALALCLVIAGCTDDGESSEPTPSETQDPVGLTLGTYRMPGAEVDALTTQLETINASRETRNVQVAASDTSLRESVDAGEALPDLFFASNQDLAWLEGEDLIEPVDAYLVARSVDFGDEISYDGVEAFSVNDRLTCMPYYIDPLVVVYNTALVDWDAMAAEGLEVPASGSWDLDGLRAAAEFASDPETGTKGLYLAPTLDQLAPFVLSGGGQVFNDETPPTSTTLSEDASIDALTPTLEVARDPLITLTPEELAQQSAMDWFTSGKLGMMLAPRSVVPELRQVEGLDFDVMFPPSIAGDRATVGTAGGICMSADAANMESAADAIVDLLDADVVEAFTETGYSVPTQLEVAQSDAFLQPDQLPASSSVYVNNLRWTYFLPPVLDRGGLDAAVAPALEALLDDAILTPETLAARAEEADAASVTVLDPGAADEQTTSPSEE